MVAQDSSSKGPGEERCIFAGHVVGIVLVTSVLSFLSFSHTYMRDGRLMGGALPLCKDETRKRGSTKHRYSVFGLAAWTSGFGRTMASSLPYSLLYPRESGSGQPDP